MRAFEDSGVRGFLHEPERGSGHGLVLAHGAGSNCQAPVLVAVAQAFAASGWAVLRIDLPFRQKRPKGPPPVWAAAEDRAGLARAAAALRNIAPGDLWLGGHSYGGRQASLLCASEPATAEMLLLLSYPLHPPDRPQDPRTAHFPQLRTPAFFVSGSRDPFGTPEDLRAALTLIPARTGLLVVEGAAHDLKPRGAALGPAAAEWCAAAGRFGGIL